MAAVAIIGTGRVGLVAGTCLADFGNKVICADTNKEKIESLNAGALPIIEKGLEEIVERNKKAGRLSFTANVAEAVRASEVIFIAVGTPSNEDGSCNLECVKAAAKEIAAAQEGYRVIALKSAVPAGTARKVAAWIKDELERRGKGGTPFDMASNPEFMGEGSAVKDFTRPARIIVGIAEGGNKALSIMKEVYRAPCLKGVPLIETSLETAETIKYAANAFLAVKAAFINEVAAFCEKAGANVQDVARAMGLDGRIGPAYLQAGPGFGGPCLPKDAKAFAAAGREAGACLSIVEAAISANERQAHLMAAKVKKALLGAEDARLDGKAIAVLGLAFKPFSSSMEKSAAIPIILDLARAGARVCAFDPAALKEAAWRLKEAGEAISLFSSEYEAAKGADALVIMTDWGGRESLDLERLKAIMRGCAFVDLRGAFCRAEVEAAGFSYTGVGV